MTKSPPGEITRRLRLARRSGEEVRKESAAGQAQVSKTGKGGVGTGWLLLPRLGQVAATRVIRCRTGPFAPIAPRRVGRSLHHTRFILSAGPQPLRPKNLLYRLVKSPLAFTSQVFGVPHGASELFPSIPLAVPHSWCPRCERENDEAYMTRPNFLRRAQRVAHQGPWGPTTAPDVARSTYRPSRLHRISWCEYNLV